MDVTFYNRDFSQRIDVNQTVNVERYSWNMIGGPDKAYLTAPANADKWELMKLLRCPIEIRGDDGGLKWWGYVNRVSLPYGEQRAGLALDELYNYVFTSDGSVAAASELQSIQEYGQKEYLLNVQNADSTQLAASRDLYLSQHQYARPEFEFAGGSDEISIECYGWFETLDWKYYSSTASTSNIENTTQLSTIVASTGQFLSGTIVEDLSNLTSNDDRDGTTTGLSNVIQILRAGTSNSLPLLAYVDKDRYLHVYERSAEPLPGAPDYLLGNDGKLYNPTNQYVPDQDCKCAVWVQVRDIPDQLGGFSAMRPFFIASAEYNVEKDKTTYTPADTYEQIRLAKYVSSAVNNNTGGGIGAASTLPIFWTPAPDDLTLDFRIFSGYTAPAYPSWLSSGNGAYQSWVTTSTGNGTFANSSTGSYIKLTSPGNYLILGRNYWVNDATGTGLVAVELGLDINDDGNVDALIGFEDKYMTTFLDMWGSGIYYLDSAIANTRIYGRVKNRTYSGTIEGGILQLVIIKL